MCVIFNLYSKLRISTSILMFGKRNLNYKLKIHAFNFNYEWNKTFSIISDIKLDNAPVISNTSYA